MSFRLVPKSVIVNDLERRNGRYFALFQRQIDAQLDDIGRRRPMSCGKSLRILIRCPAVTLLLI